MARALPMDTQLTWDVQVQGETVDTTWKEADPIPNISDT